MTGAKSGACVLDMLSETAKDNSHCSCIDVWIRQRHLVDTSRRSCGVDNRGIEDTIVVDYTHNTNRILEYSKY